MRCELSGTVSLVTGAARGIGQAIADRMASNGSTVVYTDIDESGARAAAERTPGAHASGLDVANSHDIVTVIDRVVSEHGRLDILVNNAGINTLAHRVTIDEFPRDEWDRILAVDLTGLYEMSKAAARAMRARGSGRIINIASIAGPIASLTMPPYSVAKGGVIVLTRIVAKELAPHGVTVNAICPGMLWTGFWQNLAQHIAESNPAFRGMTARQVFEKRVAEIIPMRCEQTPDDVGWAAVFLASDQARCITGQSLMVDGGVAI